MLIRPTRVAAVSCQELAPSLNQCIYPAFLSLRGATDAAGLGAHGTTRPSLDLPERVAPRRRGHYVRVSKDRRRRFALVAATGRRTADNLGAMPMEGHWRRANTPLRRLTGRERNVLIAGVAVVVVAIAALLLATGGGSRPAPGRGCIYVVVAGRVGGEPVHGCGATARAICARSARFDDPRAAKIGEACRRAGIGIGAMPPLPPSGRTNP